MGLPAVITTARLRLVLMDHDDAADMLAGRRQDRWHPHYPRRDDVDAASLVRPGGDPWGPRHVVLDRLAVGSIGCFGPPDDGEVEIGFGLVEGARGQGIATEAVLALIVEAQRVSVRLRASVRPDNAASLRVLAKCGFTELRGSSEDGELVMARPQPRETLHDER